MTETLILLGVSLAANALQAYIIYKNDKEYCKLLDKYCNLFVKNLELEYEKIFGDL